MRSYVAMDGTLSKADARAAAQRSGSAWDPLLILVPLRLGIEAINPVYFAAVKVRNGMIDCTPALAHGFFAVGMFRNPFLRWHCGVSDGREFYKAAILNSFRCDQR